MNVKYPNITVELVGQNGNVFNLMGIVSRALRKEGIDPEEFTNEIFNCKSYDEALQVMMKWVNVE